MRYRIDTTFYRNSGYMSIKYLFRKNKLFFFLYLLRFIIRNIIYIYIYIFNYEYKHINIYLFHYKKLYFAHKNIIV